MSAAAAEKIAEEEGFSRVVLHFLLKTKCILFYVTYIFHLKA
jgi:hypothetical protein